MQIGGGWGVAAFLRRSDVQSRRLFNVFPSYPLSVHTLAHSFARTKYSTLLFSIVSALFAKNHPGWGVLLPRACPAGISASLRAIERVILRAVLRKRQEGHKTSHLWLFDKLKGERDAHSVHQHDALIDQLLVGDFGIHELKKCGTRADKLHGFRCAFGTRSKLVQKRKIK